MCTANYFTFVDLIKSTTADHLGIDNHPSDEIREELELTVCKVNLISLIAYAYGTTIRVMSGYRCERLNKALGGVANSLHMKGRAVDFVVSDGKIKHALYESLASQEARDRLRICELIEYKNFIHIGFLKSC